MFSVVLIEALQLENVSFKLQFRMTVKVDEIANPAATRMEVMKHLGSMNVFQFCDGFDFQNNLAEAHEIGFKRRVEFHALVAERQLFFAQERDASQSKLNL